MQKLLDKNGKARVPFDPDLYRHISYERVKTIMGDRGHLNWPGLDPERSKERYDLLAQGAEMPLSGVMQMICEYEAGELNRAEILKMFGALIDSELITIMPPIFQYIAFKLVVRGWIEPTGKVLKSNETPPDCR